MSHPYAADTWFSMQKHHVTAGTLTVDIQMHCKKHNVLQKNTTYLLKLRTRVSIFYFSAIH